MSATQHPPQAAQVAATKGKNWKRPEEITFLDFLVTCKPKAGDGTNFQARDFKAAAANLAEVHPGVSRTAEACRTKYGSLKKTYFLVCKIRSNSGWTWSDDTGASITPAQQGSWEEFAKANPKSGPFRNHGWHLLQQFDTLEPSTATGRYSYRARQGLPPPSEDAEPTESQTSTYVPDDDEPTGDGGLGDNQGEEDDEDDEDSLPENPSIPAPSPPSHKRTAAVGAAGALTKAARTSRAAASPRASTGAQALADIGRSMSRHNDIMEAALAPRSSRLDATPVRKKKAIELAQELEDDLSDNELLSLVLVFETDVGAADAYTSLIRPSLRKKWVEKKLDDML